MSAVDDSLIADFITESREHLNEIEPDLLQLEQQGEHVSQEIVNRVFRAIHSIKGGASFLAFEALKSLSHAMENVLMLIRNGDLKASGEIVDPLLRAVDILRVMLDDIGNSDAIPIQAEVDQLNGILSAHGKGPKTASAPADSDMESAAGALMSMQLDLPDPDALRACLRDGMRFFCVGVEPARDIQGKNRVAYDVVAELNAVGKCLATSIPLPRIEANDIDENGFHALAASVLEKDMLSMGVGIPETSIDEIPKKTIEGLLEPKRSALAPAESGMAQAAANAPGAEKKAAGTAGARSAETVESLRVRVDLLNRLMNTAGELVLGRNQLLRALDGMVESVPGLLSILQNVDRVTTELQEGIMQTRMQAVGTLFTKFPRVVRDLSRQLGKEIVLQQEGSEVELDKSIIEMLSDPLTHIVRNCVDHAIELPAERKAAGKNPVGNVHLLAYHEGGQVNITISDDGRGIDPAKIRRLALEKGVIDRAAAERMSDREAISLIFAPGFSTATVVTDISGRGVGMDVVRTNIEKLGGYIEVDSEIGVGTTVMLRLPLTLAIIPCLVVGVGEARFAVPQVSIKELVWVRAHEVAERIDTLRGAPVLRLRGRLLPLVRMADLLDMPRTFVDPESGEREPDRRENIADRRTRRAADTEESRRARRARSGRDRRENWRGDYNILVLKAGSNQFGIIVDELFDGEEIVVKPLSVYLKQLKFFAGTTILGDGRVIMILDASGIAEEARLEFGDLAAEEKRRQEEEARRRAEANRDRHSVILFTNSPEEQFAVSQNHILRLERLSVKDIRTVGNQSFIHYLGKGLPIVRLDRHLPVKPMPEDAEDLYLLIPKADRDGKSAARAGIVVLNIVDAVDVEVNLEPPLLQGPGLEGSAIIQDKLTLFLNPGRLLDAAGIVDAV